MKLTVSKLGNIVSRKDFEELISENESFTVQMGRSEDCHIHLDDMKISRVLADLEYSAGKWFLKSDSLVHALTINHVPIGSVYELKNNDTLRVLDFSIEFEIPQKEEESAAEKPQLESDNNQLESSIVIPDDLPSDDISIEDDEMATAMMDTPIEDLEDLDDLNLDDDPIDLDEPDTAKEQESAEDMAGLDMLEDQVSNEGESEIFGEEEAQDQPEEYDDQYSEDEYSEDQYSENEYGENVDSEGQTGQFENEFIDEGGYGDGDYDVDSYDGDSTQVMTEFANYSLELFGEFAPYDSFNITESEIYIGRDSSRCQIVLNDPEVSTVHAVIKRVGATCVLEDKQSANGTILNGKRINSTPLVNEDEFIIGSTTFTVHVGNEFIDVQKGSLMPVAENQEVVIEEIVEINNASDDDDDLDEESLAPNDNSLVGKFKALPPQRKVIYVVIMLAVAFILLDDDSGAPVKKVNKNQQKKAEVAKKVTPKIDLSKEQLEERNAFYLLAKQDAEEGKFEEAKLNVDKALKIDPNYIQAKQLSQVISSNLAKIAELNAQKRKELERERLRKEVKELVEKAKVATKERNVGLAQSLFKQIKIKDPRNFDVSTLEADLNAWMDAENKKKLEQAQKKAERKRMVDALKPGETLFLKEQWYRAVIELEKFLRIKEMDEDLVKKGAQMLKDAKNNLNRVVGPLLGKARALKEGEDLKAAYQTYSEILKYDPSSSEALSEMDDINDTLTIRSRRVYREAIISESLGLFDDAKQKFQEVQQIAPKTNEYYKKATERLESLL